MSLSSAINQVTGLINVWSDKNASLGKKLLTTVTTIGMLLPLLVRMRTNIYDLGVSNLTAAAATDAHAAALVTEATAAAGATGPTYAFGTALNYALGPIGWAVIAITALVGVFAALKAIIGESKSWTLAD